MFNAKTGLKKITKVSDQITLLTYASKEQLCKAFLRVEEYYESPEFKGKIFTLGQYREWYAQRYGAFSYFGDWSGFNIPSDAFEVFNRGLFDPLTPEEQELIDLFKPKAGRFCVIGTFEGGDPDVYEHEISHAMFATNDAYKAEVLAALEGQNLDALKKYLTEDMGYNESVALDECHAYIGESFAWLNEKKIPYPAELQPKLQAIKRKYRGDIK